MVNPRSSAFTLVELLVVVAILAVLAGIGSAAYFSAVDKAGTVAEITAAKTLMTAYQAAAADRGGLLLPSRARSATDVLNGEGNPISNREVSARYPFRLAPYFNYAIDDTLLASSNKSQILQVMKLPSASGPMYDYGISVFPSFGISRYLVGGNADEDMPSDECVRTLAQADHSIITFVSAGSDEINGYEYVRSPGEPGGNWSASPWSDDSSPGDYGHVHPRHQDKAVAAFLDGSVRLMTVEELRDMRLWSRQAAMRNDPAYRPGS